MTPSYEALLEFWQAYRAELDSVGGLWAAHGTCPLKDDECLEPARTAYRDAIRRKDRALDAINEEINARDSSAVQSTNAG